MRRIASIALLSLSLSVFSVMAFSQVRCCRKNSVTPPVTPPRLLFGFNQNRTGGAEEVTGLTFGKQRFWDGQCVWALIETSAGVYNFPGKCDAFVNSAVAHGAQPVLVMGRTPASRITGTCTSSYGTGCAQMPSDIDGANAIIPAFINAWNAYMNSSHPGVKWSIEGVNEADLAGECAENSSIGGHCSAVHLVKYQTAVYNTVKAINSNIQVLCPAASTFNHFGVHGYGGTDAGSPPFGGNGWVNAGILSFCDAMNVHPYFFNGSNNQTNPEEAVNGSSGGFSGGGLGQIAGLLASVGKTGFPVESSETDWGSNVANTMSDQLKREWIDRYHVYAWAAGQTNITWYEYTCASGVLANCFGTISNAGVGAAVKTSLATMQDWLIGSSKAVGNPCTVTSGTYVCNLTINTASGKTGPAMIVFNNAGATVSVSANNFSIVCNDQNSCSAVTGNQVTTTGTAQLLYQSTTGVAFSGQAFKGAQGGGAATVGGRGGKVDEVTNLNGSGAGSLSACLLDSGARTCVFRVAGIICPDNGTVGQNPQVNNPFITIAGQTAPGQIIIGGSTCTSGIRFSTHDVIIRYITFSPDNPNVPSGPDTGTLGFYEANTQAFNYITDHVSSRWSGNKMWLMFAGFAGEYNKDSTMQNSLMYEPHAMHAVGPSTSENDDPTRTAASGNIDFHHTYFVNIGHRITEYNHSPIRWINNVTSNWGLYAYLGLGATQADIVNNIWQNNNLTHGFSKPIYSTDGTFTGSNPGTPSFFISGNIGPGQTTPNVNQVGDLAGKAQGENVTTDLGAFPGTWVASSLHAASNAFPITIDPAVGLIAEMNPHIGNHFHLDCNGNQVSHQDQTDLRIINQVTVNGPGGFWPNAITVEGPSSIPTPNTDYQDHVVTGFTVCTESQHDGIPDAWKTLKGLSTTDPNLHNAHAPSGWTWLEEYLNLVP